MTTAYTSLLGFALPVTGELSGTWGDTVNNGITSLLDSAIAGTTTLSADSDVTLTTTQGSSNTAREAILLWTAGGSATRTITAPAQSKIYTVINASSGTQSIILAGAGPTSGVTIAKGESALCAWNGSDFIKISNTAGPGTFTNLTVTGNTTLGDADTDTITQAASYVTGTQLKSAKTATNTLSLAAYDVDGTAYTNLITLTAGNTPTLALTSTGVGTINNMSIGATTASTGAFTTLSASGIITSTATAGQVVKAESGTTGILYSNFANTGGTFLYGIDNSAGTALFSGSAAYAGFIGTSGARPLVLATNGAGRAFIDSSGNVGIGTSSPSSILTVSSIGSTIELKQNAAGSATYYVMDNTVESGGKRWRFGYTGAAGISTFSLYNATDNVTAWVADSSGNLLVGKTSSSATTGDGFGFSPDGQGHAASTYTTNAATVWSVYSTGAAAYRFYVGYGGTIFATSIVITAISDERLKENVRDIDTGLSSIMALKPRRFDWKEGKGQDKKDVAGFIAQEFETVFPECVSTSKAGADGIEYKNINHETLIPTLVKAIQEQQALITTLTARITALEGA